tara:strand:- start:593 stop:1000 length:408 start_codon:yes stop_codon:yes gene_type:complete
MTLTFNGYNAGHPWYYKLGGTILTPKEILTTVKLSGYQGYMADDIVRIDKKAEPERSKALREIKDKILVSMWRNISCYRLLANQLRFERKLNGIDRLNTSSNELHTSMSLKHNHIYNDLAHLNYLDDLLTQFELF